MIRHGSTSSAQASQAGEAAERSAQRATHRSAQPLRRFLCHFATLAIVNAAVTNHDGADYHAVERIYLSQQPEPRDRLFECPTPELPPARRRKA